MKDAINSEWTANSEHIWKYLSNNSIFYILYGKILYG